MIDLRPYDDMAAMAVLSRLDPHDHMEAELVRGAGATHLALFAEWRAMEAARAASFVATTHGRPFALLALANTGQAGVGAACLLACDHRRHRIALARLCVTVRRALPGWCAERGVHRIEARAWAAHPTAARLLTGMGFIHEADLPGFGADGQAWFRQFAWLYPDHPVFAAAPPSPIPEEV